MCPLLLCYINNMCLVSAFTPRRLTCTFPGWILVCAAYDPFPPTTSQVSTRDSQPVRTVSVLAAALITMATSTVYKYHTRHGQCGGKLAQLPAAPRSLHICPLPTTGSAPLQLTTCRKQVGAGTADGLGEKTNTDGEHNKRGKSTEPTRYLMIQGQGARSNLSRKVW